MTKSNNECQLRFYTSQDYYLLSINILFHCANAIQYDLLYYKHYHILLIIISYILYILIYILSFLSLFFDQK